MPPGGQENHLEGVGGSAREGPRGVQGGKGPERKGVQDGEFEGFIGAGDTGEERRERTRNPMAGGTVVRPQSTGERQQMPRRPRLLRRELGQRQATREGTEPGNPDCPLRRNGLRVRRALSISVHLSPWDPETLLTSLCLSFSISGALTMFLGKDS